MVAPPPEDEEDVFHCEEAVGVAVTPILLGLAILRGGTAVISFEKVALLEGVVDRRLVAWTGLLQHVVEYAGASRCRSRTPSSWVNSESLVSVVIAPLRARLAAWLLALLARLCFCYGSLDLLPSAGASSTLRTRSVPVVDG
jgi:hypothetical protein